MDKGKGREGGSGERRGGTFSDDFFDGWEGVPRHIASISLYGDFSFPSLSLGSSYDHAATEAAIATVVASPFRPFLEGVLDGTAR